jgi:hypothetical protein
MQLQIQRRLELALTLFDKPYAWKCTVCGRLFAIKWNGPGFRATEHNRPRISDSHVWPLAEFDDGTRSILGIKELVNRIVESHNQR